MARDRATGKLDVRAGAVSKHLFFQDGVLVHVSCRSSEDSLGTMLVREGKLTPAELSEAVRAMAETGRAIGALLLELDKLSPEELVSALERQARARVARCLGAPEVSLRMNDEAPPDVALLQIDVGPLVAHAVLTRFGTQRILSEMPLDSGGGLSWAKGGEPLIDRLSLSDVHLTQLRELRSKNLAGVLQEAGGGPPLKWLRLLYLLWVAGAVRFKGEEESPSPTSAPLHLMPMPSSVAAVLLIDKLSKSRGRDPFTVLEVAPGVSPEAATEAAAYLAGSYRLDDPSSFPKTLQPRVAELKTLVEQSLRSILQGNASPQSEAQGAQADLDPFLVGGIQIEAGRHSLRHGQPDEAEAAFEEAAKLLPDDPQTHFLMGCCQLLRGEGAFPVAQRAFEFASLVDPSFADPHIFLIYLHARAGEPRKAEEAFRAAMAIDPGARVACQLMLSLARNEMATKKPDAPPTAPPKAKPSPAADSAFMASPETPVALPAPSRPAAAPAGRLPPAPVSAPLSSLFDDLGPAKPGDSDPFDFVGGTLAKPPPALAPPLRPPPGPPPSLPQLGRPIPRAESAASRAAEPFRAGVDSSQAMESIKTAVDEQLRAKLERAAEDYPDPAQQRAYRRAVELRLRAPEEAIDELIGSAAMEAAAFDLRATRPDGAVEMARLAVVLRPGDSKANLLLGKALAQKVLAGDSALADEARAALEKAASLEPRGDEAMLALGQMLGRVGRAGEAKKAFEHAIARNRFSLATILSESLLPRQLGIGLPKALVIAGAASALSLAVGFFAAPGLSGKATPQLAAGKESGRVAETDQGKGEAEKAKAEAERKAQREAIAAAEAEKAKAEAEKKAQGEATAAAEAEKAKAEAEKKAQEEAAAAAEAEKAQAQAEKKAQAEADKKTPAEAAADKKAKAEEKKAKAEAAATAAAERKAKAEAEKTVKAEAAAEKKAKAEAEKKAKAEAAATAAEKKSKEEGAGAKPAAGAAKDPKAAAAKVSAGDGFLRAGDAEKAIPAFKAALKADPESAVAHRGLGMGYAMMGEDAKALKEYEAYLKMVPDAADAERIRAIVNEMKAH